MALQPAQGTTPGGESRSPGAPRPSAGAPARGNGSTSARREDRRWNQVDVRIRRLGARPDGLIEVLHTVQEVFGYLDDDALRYVSHALAVPPSQVMGVATFYTHFTLKPQGAHTCVVCTGTACWINGARPLLAHLAERFGISPGQTSSDGELSALAARCVGACSMAPAVVLDGEVHGRVDPTALDAILERAVLERAVLEGAAAEPGQLGNGVRRDPALEQA